MRRKSEKGEGNIKRLDPPEEERRNYLKTVGALVAGLAIGGVAGWLSKPAERVEVPVPGPTTTVTKTVTAPITPTLTPVPEKIKLGLLFPLTGPYAGMGKDQLDNALMAIDKFREKGWDIEHFTRDTEAKPEESVRRGKELFEREKIHYLIGPLASKTQYAFNEYAKEWKRMWWSGAGCPSELRQKGVRSDYAFWTFSDVDLMGSVGADFAYKYGARSTYGIFVDYVWGYLVSEHFGKTLEKLGGELAREYFPLGTTDFSSWITKALGTKPDMFLFGGGGTDAINFLKQAKEFGLQDKIPIYIIQLAPYTYGRGVGAEALEGVYAGADFLWNDELPITKRYTGEFMERYGYPPDIFGRAVYTDVMELLSAIERANSLDYDDITKQIEDEHEFEWTKGKEKWRACDHQALGFRLILKGKSPKDVVAEWDYFEVVDRIPHEEHIPSCKELGY